MAVAAASGEGGWMVRVDPAIRKLLAVTSARIGRDARSARCRVGSAVDVEDLRTDDELAAWVRPGHRVRAVAAAKALAKPRTRTAPISRGR